MDARAYPRIVAAKPTVSESTFALQSPSVANCSDSRPVRNTSTDRRTSRTCSCSCASDSRLRRKIQGRNFAVAWMRHAPSSAAQEASSR